MDVRNLFELQRAFERDRILRAATEEQEAVRVAVTPREHLQLRAALDDIAHLLWQLHELGEQRARALLR